MVAQGPFSTEPVGPAGRFNDRFARQIDLAWRVQNVAKAKSRHLL
jgi:hypothetical protein